MSTVLPRLVAAAAVLALAAPVFAKTETVKGQVIDEGCSMKEMNGHTDGDHKMAEDMAECAVDCAKRGEPLALLTPDGKVYRIVGGLAANKNAKLIPHVNHTVEITGDVAQRDGRMTIAANDLKAVK